MFNHATHVPARVVLAYQYVQWVNNVRPPVHASSITSTNHYGASETAHYDRPRAMSQHEDAAYKAALEVLHLYLRGECTFVDEPAGPAAPVAESSPGYRDHCASVLASIERSIEQRRSHVPPKQ